MEALLERGMSCSEFVDEGLIPDLSEEPRDEAISLLSYHFRKLREAGLIQVVERVPGRGSDAHVCRASEALHHTDEEWSRLSRDERQAITPMTLSSLTGLAEVAVLYDTFDNRIDRHLAYVPMELDEQAWQELGPVLNGVLDVVLRVKGEATKRLEESGDQPFRAVYGGMLFESPPLPRGDR